MGLSQRIGDPHNGNFLGIIELVSRYDPVLQLHVNKMGEAQRQGNRVPVHYLSSDSQNEFIAACAGQVQAKILYNLKEAKYYSMIVDATPDSAHMEQTTFILRYVLLPQDGTSYEINETFVDCNKKTGSDIAELILRTLSSHNISIKFCRGQGYDNGANMAGKYKGAQACIQKYNNLAVFSPCAFHGLNLCGTHAAECCEHRRRNRGGLEARAPPKFLKGRLSPPKVLMMRMHA